MKLKLNQKITLIVDEAPYNGEYQSRIEDLNKDWVSIAYPTQSGVLVPIRVGTKVRVIVTDELAAYDFTGFVESRETQPIPVLKIAIPAEVKRIQRREYVRLDVILPATIFLGVTDSMGFKTETLDVSGGGCKLAISEYHYQLLYDYLKQQEKPRFRILFEVTDERDNQINIHCLGKLQRKGELERKSWIAVEFRRIDKKTREEIIRFVYRKQLEQRNRGLL